MDDKEANNRMFEELISAVRALALPCEVQLTLFPDFAMKADELALDYDWAHPFFLQDDDHVGVAIGQSQRDAMVELDNLLQRMSRGGDLFNNNLWADEGLCSDPIWEDVRQKAKHLLESFGQDYPEDGAS